MSCDSHTSRHSETVVGYHVVDGYIVAATDVGAGIAVAAAATTGVVVDTVAVVHVFDVVVVVYVVVDIVRMDKMSTCKHLSMPSIVTFSRECERGKVNASIAVHPLLIY